MAAKKKAVSRSSAPAKAAKKKTRKSASLTWLAPVKIFSGKAKAALERVRKICLALEDVEEKISHGSPAFFRRKKQFVHFFDNHHGDARLAIWCRAPEGAQAMLIESNAAHFFIPPYVGSSGWIGLRLDQPDTDYAEVRAVLEEAWRCSAPNSAKKR